MEKTNIRASFLITGNGLITEIVTRRLSIVPTRHFMKGDEIKEEGYTKGAKRKLNLWQVSTEHEESRDINVQVLKIVDLMKEKVDLLNSLKEEYDLEYTITIGIHVKSGLTPAMHFERWFLDFLHSIGAEVDIDLYC